jgi:4-amino-4-deoxy-L-arabinose transferase
MANAGATVSPLERHRTLVVLIIAFVGAAAFQGSRGLYEPTEARYSEVAREMVVSGDYLHPTLSGQPHFTKPPLAYWSIAVGIKLFGVNAWGARFGNVIAFVITVLALSQIGVLVWGERAGLLAGVVYASAPLAFAGAAVTSADTLLTMWVVLSMLGFVGAWGEERPNCRRWWIRAMWVALGFGFMTKGPPALLPLLVIVIFRLVSRRRAGLADPLGLVLFFGTGFWWYIWIVVERPELFRYFIGYEIVARNISGAANRNPQWYAPVTVFLPTLIVGAAPWLAFALRRRFVLSAISEPSQSGRISRDLAALVTLWWFSIPLVVFSLSKSRLPLYVLQIMPPLALWIVAVIRRRGTSNRTLAVTAGTTLLVLIAVKGSVVYLPNRADAGRLFSAVQAAGGADTEVLLVEHPGEHGLEFYTRGRLVRVSVGYRAPWADTTLEEALDKVRKSPTSHTKTIVVDGSQAATVTTALKHAGIVYIGSRVAGRELLVLR